MLKKRNEGRISQKNDKIKEKNMEIKNVRLMWGIGLEDLQRAKELGCNVAHHPTFDGQSEDYQRRYVAKCKELGMKVCWSMYGGSAEAKRNREATVKRWRNDDVVFAWYIISEPVASKTTIEAQKKKRDWIRGLDKTKPILIDWGLWSHDSGTYPYRTDEVADILMIYSYPYERGHSPDSAFNRYFNHLSALNTRNLPVIPLLQCFYGGNFYDPQGKIAENFNRWKGFLKSKGWFGNNAGFYIWDGGYTSVIKKNQNYQQEIKELNTGIPSPEPEPQPHPEPEPEPQPDDDNVTIEDIRKDLGEIKDSVASVTTRIGTVEDRLNTIITGKQELTEEVAKIRDELTRLDTRLVNVEDKINNL